VPGATRIHPDPIQTGISLKIQGFFGKTSRLNSIFIVQYSFFSKPHFFGQKRLVFMIPFHFFSTSTPIQLGVKLGTQFARKSGVLCSDSNFGGKRCFGSESVWTLTECDWCAATYRAHQVDGLARITGLSGSGLLNDSSSATEQRPPMPFMTYRFWAGYNHERFGR